MSSTTSSSPELQQYQKDAKMKDLEIKAAGVAGFGILALCFLGGYAESTREGISLEVLHKYQEDSNPDDLPGKIRIIVLCFFLTGVLDVFVALALLAFCVASRSVSSSVKGNDVEFNINYTTADHYSPLSTVFTAANCVAASSAMFRIAYVCVLLSCLNGLAQVPKLLDTKSTPKDAVTGLLVRQLWESFYFGFNGVALGLFGLHLALLAVPLWKRAGDLALSSSGSSSRPIFSGIILPISLVVAGVGYTVDAFGIFLQDKTFGLTKNGCFVGEVLLMGWLMVMSVSGLAASSSASSTSGGDSAVASRGDQPFLE